MLHSIVADNIHHIHDVFGTPKVHLSRTLENFNTLKFICLTQYPKSYMKEIYGTTVRFEQIISNLTEFGVWYEMALSYRHQKI